MGEETDTGDREGNIIRTGDPSGITEEQIQQALHIRRGVIDQVPPHFSALKKEGVRLASLPRRGSSRSLLHEKSRSSLWNY